VRDALAVGACVSLDVDAHAGGVHHPWREGAVGSIGSIVLGDGEQEVLPMRIPVRTRRIGLIAAVALVVTAAGCGGNDDFVTIPSSDGSSPSVVMDAHFNVEQRPYVTVTNGSTPQQADAEPDETVTFIATGTDTDGGVKTIEIWHTRNGCPRHGEDFGDGTGATCQPLLLRSIAAKNPDPDIMKTAGETAAKSRTVSYNVHFPVDSNRSFEETVWAKVINWAGAERETARTKIDGRT
jgi:hypothetical protein